jgi:type 1 glutamine amidotransferase
MPKKIVFLAGEKSHGPGDHEYEKGLRFFQRALEASELAPRIRTELHRDGWPEDPATLDDADTIVIFSDGSDHNLEAHPLFRGDRIETLRPQMARGCGFVVLHYSTFAPVGPQGDAWLEWMGGFFDYETGPGGGWRSAIEFRDFEVFPQAGHPVARGLAPFQLREEFYFKMRFRDADPRLRPVLTLGSPDAGLENCVAWTVEREDGGRGFGFTGGHHHRNWDHPAYRTLLLNAIAWTAHLELPAEGLQTTLRITDPR